MKFCLSVILLFLFIDCSAQSYQLNFLKSDSLFQKAKQLYPNTPFKRYTHDEELLAFCRESIGVKIRKTEIAMGLLFFTIDETGKLIKLVAPIDKDFGNVQLDTELINTISSMISRVPHWRPFNPELKGKKETYILFFQLIYEKTY